MLVYEIDAWEDVATWSAKTNRLFTIFPRDQAFCVPTASVSSTRVRHYGCLLSTTARHLRRIVRAISIRCPCRVYGLPLFVVELVPGKKSFKQIRRRRRRRLEFRSAEHDYTTINSNIPCTPEPNINTGKCFHNSIKRLQLVQRNFPSSVHFFQVCRAFLWTVHVQIVSCAEYKHTHTPTRREHENYSDLGFSVDVSVAS